MSLAVVLFGIEMLLSVFGTDSHKIIVVVVRLPMDRGGCQRQSAAAKLDEWTDETLTEVVFHLVHEPKVPYSPLNIWDGKLFICGRRVGAEPFWRMVDGTDEVRFQNIVGGAYSMELGSYYVSVDVSRPRGRRSKSGRAVLSLSVSLLLKNQKRGAPAE